MLVLSGDGTAPIKAANLGVEGLRKPVELDVLLEAVRRSCIVGGEGDSSPPSPRAGRRGMQR